jgi:hypothetical protein
MEAKGILDTLVKYKGEQHGFWEVFLPILLRHLTSLVYQILVDSPKSISPYSMLECMEKDMTRDS